MGDIDGAAKFYNTLIDQGWSEAEAARVVDASLNVIELTTEERVAKLEQQGADCRRDIEELRNATTQILAHLNEGLRQENKILREKLDEAKG